MRIAVFSDVHGNAIALDAVLADVESTGGVDAYWFIGDAADMGSDPTSCLDRLRRLPNLTAVHGNGDRSVVERDLAEEATLIQSVAHDDALLLLAYLEEAAWTRGAITQAGLFEWLAALPFQARVTMPDGTRVLLVHAAPGTDEGPGIRVEQSDEEVRSSLTDAQADLVIVGHTHTPLDRTVDDVRVVNPGSVSNPVTEDQRAMWMLVDADRSGYSFERRYTGYDQEAYLRTLSAVHHPAEGMIRQFFERG